MTGKAVMLAVGVLFTLGSGAAFAQTVWTGAPNDGYGLSYGVPGYYSTPNSNPGSGYTSNGPSGNVTGTEALTGKYNYRAYPYGTYR